MAVYKTPPGSCLHQLTDAEWTAVHDSVSPNQPRSEYRRLLEEGARRALAKRKEEHRRNNPELRSGRWSDGKLYYHVGLLVRRGRSVAVLVGRLLNDMKHKIAEHGEHAHEWDRLGDWAYTLGLSPRQTWRTIQQVQRLGLFRFKVEVQRRTRLRVVHFYPTAKAVKMAEAIKTKKDRLESVSRALEAQLGTTGTVLWRHIRHACLPRPDSKHLRVFSYTRESLRVAMPWLRGKSAFRMAICRLVQRGAVIPERLGALCTYRVPAETLEMTDLEVAEWLASVTKCPSSQDVHLPPPVTPDPPKASDVGHFGVASQDVQFTRHQMSTSASQDVPGAVANNSAAIGSKAFTGSLGTGSLSEPTSASPPSAPVHRTKELSVGWPTPASAPDGASAGRAQPHGGLLFLGEEEEALEAMRQDQEAETLREYQDHQDHLRSLDPDWIEYLEAMEALTQEAYPEECPEGREVQAEVSPVAEPKAIQAHPSPAIAPAGGAAGAGKANPSPALRPQGEPAEAGQDQAGLRVGPPGAPVPESFTRALGRPASEPEAPSEVDTAPPPLKPRSVRGPGPGALEPRPPEEDTAQPAQKPRSVRGPGPGRGHDEPDPVPELPPPVPAEPVVLQRDLRPPWTMVAELPTLSLPPDEDAAQHQEDEALRRLGELKTQKVVDALRQQGIELRGLTG